MTARTRAFLVICCLYCMNTHGILKQDYNGQPVLWLALPLLHFYQRAHKPVDGLDKDPAKSKNTPASADGSSRSVTRSRSLPRLTGRAPGDTPGGSGGEEPPEQNGAGSRESFGKECLPVWVDPGSANTVVFRIRKEALLSSEQEGFQHNHITPAVTISIYGQPVTFYLSRRAGKDANPFLVARPGRPELEETLTPGQIIRMAAQYGLDITSGQAARLATPVFHQAVELEQIQVQAPEAANASKPAPETWYQDTQWNIHVSNTEGTLLAQLEGITFQALINVSLFGGYVMDGLLHQHFQQAHSVPHRSSGQYRQLVCDLCQGCRIQYHEMQVFWNQLQVLLSSDDCPEELLFRISFTPGKREAQGRPGKKHYSFSEKTKES